MPTCAGFCGMPTPSPARKLTTESFIKLHKSSGIYLPFGINIDISFWTGFRIICSDAGLPGGGAGNPGCGR